MWFDLKAVMVVVRAWWGRGGDASIALAAKGVRCARSVAAMAQPGGAQRHAVATAGTAETVRASGWAVAHG